MARVSGSIQDVEMPPPRKLSKAEKVAKKKEKKDKNFRCAERALTELIAAVLVARLSPRSS